jgi:hypothetical protein
MEYGVIYTKICPKDGTPGDWIKYCHFLSETPKSFQENVKRIVDDINSIYKEDIVISMDEDVHPGCTTKPEKVREIAEEMYRLYSEMCERQGIPNTVRTVYTIGELDNVDKESTHYLNGETMVKLGRFLDESDETGIYEI